MGYGRGDSFPFGCEPNLILFGSKSNGKLQPRSYPIQCERKGKHSFISVYCLKQYLLPQASCWHLLINSPRRLYDC